MEKYSPSKLQTEYHVASSTKQVQYITMWNLLSMFIESTMFLQPPVKGNKVK